MYSWITVGLCLILLIPEPATFALLVLTVACLLASTLRTVVGGVGELTRTAPSEILAPDAE